MLLTELLDTELSDNFYIKLFENKIPFIINQNKKKLEDRYSKDTNIPANIKSKIGDDVATDLVNLFANYDPTPKKKYTQWMTRIYLNGEKLEDFYKLTDSLKIFDKVKPKLEQRDINQYKTIGQISAIVAPFEDTEVLSNKELDKMKKAEGAEYVIKTPDFKVIHTKTHEANCLYGANTKWCTASRDDNSQFNSHSKQGPLYVILAGAGSDPRKFQFHYESNQVMDEQDNPISKSDIDYLSKFPQYKNFLNMMIKKHYKKYDGK